MGMCVIHLICVMVISMKPTNTLTSLASDCYRQHGNIMLTSYKERAAPPIGGTALHDSGVKTVQWRKREGHDSYQEVEVYIYKYI